MKQKNNYVKEINIKDFYIYLRNKYKRILIVCIAFIIILLGVIFVKEGASLFEKEDIVKEQVSDYSGKATIFLGNSIDVKTAEAIRTYLLSYDIIQNVIVNLGIDMHYYTLSNMITLQGSTDSIIYITVIGKDEELVQNITSELVTLGNKKISEKFNIENIKVLDPAYTLRRYYDVENKIIVKSLTEFYKALIKYIVLGFLMGFFLICGFYTFAFISNKSINNEKDIEGFLLIPILGTIPSIYGTKKTTESRKKKSRLSQYSIKK